MIGDNADTSTGMGAIGRMQVVVRCERVSHLYLCTPERQSLCESHRQRRWLTHWSKPQAKFLGILFATILALRGRVNFRNLSRYCAYCERTIARQFRRTFDWPAFHQRVLTVALDSRSEVISAQDASFISKSGKQTFGLGHFFNGCTSRAERGLEISTLAVVDVTRRCAFTVACAQTPPAARTATAQEKEETLVDFYQQQLREHRHRLPPGVQY